MEVDLEKVFAERRQKLKLVLAKAAADFLEQEGGLPIKHILESFAAAPQMLVLTKFGGTISLSPDLPDAGQ